MKKSDLICILVLCLFGLGVSIFGLVMSNEIHHMNTSCIISSVITQLCGIAAISLAVAQTWRFANAEFSESPSNFPVPTELWMSVLYMNERMA